MPDLPSGKGPTSRDGQSRLVVSTLITSAPIWASCSVQYGPAHTHVKSTTRIPDSGCLPALGRKVADWPGLSRVAGDHASPRAISEECSPKRGAGRRMLH